MKRRFSLFCVAIAFLLVIGVFTSNGVASAQSLPTMSQSNMVATSLTNTVAGRQINALQSRQLSLQSYQLAAQKAMEEAGLTNVPAVHANSVTCRIITYQNQSGSLCVTVYLACVGPVCVPYAASLDFSQKLIDRLASSGAAGAAFIVSIVSAWFPALAPFAGIISGFLAYAFVSLDNYAKDSCGGNGAGIYINFAPSFFYFYCG